jgi:predicted lactoylglutathione lyase
LQKRIADDGTNKVATRIFLISLTAAIPKKACRAFVEKANQAGGKVELLLLPEIGIMGNSHMIMQDSNSIQIADILGSWIEQRIKN